MDGSGHAAGAEFETLEREIVRRLPLRAPAFLPTSRVAPADRVAGLRHVLSLYEGGLDRVHRPRLRALRDRFAGARRAFLIGNGPSLNRTDLEPLRHEVTFASNGFLLKLPELGWSPTFYCVEDRLTAEDRAEGILALTGSTRLVPAHLAYVVPDGPDTIFLDHRPAPEGGPVFSREADRMTHPGGSVTFLMLQVAAWLGFRELILVGMDGTWRMPPDAWRSDEDGASVLDMATDDPNHFHPDYCGKGIRWHEPRPDRMARAFAEARRAIEEAGQTVSDATIGGRLDLFERVRFHDIFPLARSPSEVERASRAVRQANQRPRLLILDRDAAGGPTAAGAIKAGWLADWPAERVLQVACQAGGGLSLVRRGPAGWAEETASPEQVEEAVEIFGADRVLWRPGGPDDRLDAFAMRLLDRETAAPFAVWATEDDAFAGVGGPDRLRRLLSRAGTRLAASAGLARVLSAGTGLPFATLGGGIDAAEWERPRCHSGSAVLLRHAGRLSPGRNAAALLEVARAIRARRRAGQPIRFEIAAPPADLAQTAPLFEGLEGTSLEPGGMPRADYVRWLCEADALVVAHDFETAATRMPVAAKLPECLAAGAAVLVYGPRSATGADRLVRAGACAVVDRPDAARLEDALERLADPAHRARLGAAGRALALREFDIETARRNLAEALAGPSGPAPAAERAAGPLYLWAGTGQPRPVATAEAEAELDRAGDGARLLLLWEHPAAEAARRLAEGSAPGPALAAWRARMEDALAVQRRCRARSLVLPMGEGAGPDLPPALRALAMPAAQPEGVDPVLAALSAAAAALDPALRPLLEELEAASTVAPTVPGWDDLAELAGALAALRAAHELAERAASAQRAEAERLAQEVQAQGAEIARLNDLRGEDGAALAVLRAEAEALREARAAAEQASAADRAEAERLVRELQAHFAEIARLNGLREADEAALAALREEVEGLRDRAARAETASAEARALLDAAETVAATERWERERLAAVLAEAEEAASALEEARAEIARLNGLREADEAALAAVRAEVADWAARLERAEAEGVESRLRLDEVTDFWEAAQQEARDERRERERLEASLSETRDSLAQVRRVLVETLAELERTARAFEDDRAALRAQLAQALDSAETLRRECESARGEVAALRASHSWRATAPLRGASRLLRRLVAPRRDVPA